MNAEPIIDVRDVCFGYGAQEVLHNISFQVADREMVAIVGPNGGGKTTLLRILLGLQVPRWGTVRIFGVAPVRARRRIGYVPQSLQFDIRFPVSVMDVVLMGRVGLRGMGRYRREDRAAACKALEQVEIPELQDRPFSALSGGQRQRVLVAQALSADPDLLLMDEPTASVDAATEYRLYELFARLRQQRAVVLVSHNLTVVTRHATSVLCVNRTADLHRIEDVTSTVFQQPGGGDWALLRHDASCHVIDPSAVLTSPHSGERDAAAAAAQAEAGTK